MINVASAIPSIGGANVVVFSVCTEMYPLKVRVPFECIVDPAWTHSDSKTYFDPEPSAVTQIRPIVVTSKPANRK